MSVDWYQFSTFCAQGEELKGHLLFTSQLFALHTQQSHTRESCVLLFLPLFTLEPCRKCFWNVKTSRMPEWLKLKNPFQKPTCTTGGAVMIYHLSLKDAYSMFVVKLYLFKFKCYLLCTLTFFSGAKCSSCSMLYRPSALPPKPFLYVTLYWLVCTKNP